MKKGFTLIELLVVIFIIAILIGLSVFGLQNARTTARDARRQADLQQIRSALEIFKADCGKYYIASSLPDSLNGVNGSPYSSSCSSSNQYLSKVPVDPVTSLKYTYSSDGITYNLCATLEQSATQYCVTNP